MFALEGTPAPIIVFGLAELFIVKYTLWDVFGKERLIINDSSPSYQQHYGFFNTALNTLPFNKKIWIVDSENVIVGNNLFVKSQFEFCDKDSLTEVVYHSVLDITVADFKKFLEYIDRLFIDDLIREYAMLEINLN
ncbi:MAG: hypothetical protein EOO20_11205 [Chryseobacterium sp.]|nr:MAG: hypothetical protein EOO20_11205 [Chryseobacterium sp.]